MRNIIYYVAASIDGFISGEQGGIRNFVGNGNGVTRYLEDLKQFDTVVMGKNTYEFGYRFGLAPGQPAYPHMQHYIFSDTLYFDDAQPQVKVVRKDISIIHELKAQRGSDIYLCGGGQFAGWLLDHELIDYLKIKLNPLVLGKGVRLFGDSRKEVITELIDSNRYDNGLQIMNYRIRY